ncbi:MAG: sensor histidine kinase [Anaerolineae bacterium]
MATWSLQLLGAQPFALDSLYSLVALGAAMVTFTGTQTLIVTGMIMAYRKVGWRQAETINTTNVLTDLLLLCVGASIAVMWEVSPLAVVLALAPLSGLYLAMKWSRDVIQLKEINRLKSNIVANVSHELRAPLSSIKLYAQLLMENLEEDDLAMRQKFLRVIDTETDHLVAFITDLLDLSRIESGEYNMEKRATSLREIIDEVTSALGIQARKQGITIKTDIPADFPPLVVDRGLMAILLKNLLSNAVKFSHKGGQVDVMARQEDGQYLISVIDRGIGIPAEAISHLFEKFYRAQTTTESGIEGTGLGLALAKEAAEAHGGVIEVESQLGEGSCFTVRLPRETAYGH